MNSNNDNNNPFDHFRNESVDELSSKAEEYTPREPVPNGIYKVRISACEVSPCSYGDGSKNGKMMKMQFKIEEGEYINQTVFNNHIFYHGNATAVEIGKGRIALLAKVLFGGQWPNSPADLINRSLNVKIVRVFDKYRTEETGEKTFKNEIKEYYPLQAGQAPAMPPQSPVMPAHGMAPIMPPPQQPQPYQQQQPPQQAYQPQQQPQPQPYQQPQPQPQPAQTFRDDDVPF